MTSINGVRAKVEIEETASVVQNNSNNLATTPNETETILQTNTAFLQSSLQMRNDLRRSDILAQFAAAAAQNVGAGGAVNNFVERHPAAQNLKFSETKSASDLAYTARTGEIYQFPDGKQWKVTETVNTPETGFRAIVLKPVDPNDKRVIVAYAGSGDKEDWKTNFQQANNKTPAQYHQAVDLARKYQNRHGDNVVLTGHSLGGGLASYASLQTGLRATAINAAPLAPKNLGGNPIFNPRVTRNDRITQYYVPGEILTDYDNLSLRQARPGNDIAIPGRYKRLDPSSSLRNHLIENVAPDVPPPVRIR